MSPTMRTENRTHMTVRSSRRIATLVCLVSTVTCGVLVSAGQTPDPGKLDVRDLVRETQKSSQEPGEVTLVWWLPEQFWRASLQQSPNVPPEQVDEFLKTVRPYL